MAETYYIFLTCDYYFVRIPALIVKGSRESYGVTIFINHLSSGIQKIYSRTLAPL